ncbi:hypothetical protein [Nannocystis sp. SCPEA4]|uniref:hypothetical protein n=1 Tax=Nannocystis sp. SCPEA4 TaxID=2996787 RepID=UPI00226E169A|nr:hypothetical protein [Nannocystis sp. SCPEA4]MCY1060519.1 hypothetical protein [Nannocystis sp. SCPEA4]
MRPTLFASILLSGLAFSACGDDGAGASASTDGPTGPAPTTNPPTTDPATTDEPPTTGEPPTTSAATGSSTTEQASATETTATSSTSGDLTTEDSTSTSSTSASSTDDTTGGPLQGCTAKQPVQPPGDCAQIGVTIEPPYDQWYTCYDLGVVPGVPTDWGGIIIDRDDPERLLAGGDANTLEGRLYGVSIARDGDCHIVGFQATPTADVAAAEYNDGGLTYHHDSHVLFLSRWPYNELGQLKPGSTVTDKVIDLNPYSVDSSPGGFTFVPPGFQGAGKLKAVSWPGGWFYTVDLAPDGGGTYDITATHHETTIVGGPEAFVYISSDNPEFAVDSLLVAEWSAGNIAAYQADNDGNPLPATRKDFIKGLEGAESAHVDALSGDFLFATFAGDERLIAIRGFQPQPQ